MWIQISKRNKERQKERQKEKIGKKKYGYSKNK
jgi:hypothetical protein